MVEATATPAEMEVEGAERRRQQQAYRVCLFPSEDPEASAPAEAEAQPEEAVDRAALAAAEAQPDL